MTRINLHNSVARVNDAIRKIHVSRACDKGVKLDAFGCDGVIPRMYAMIQSWPRDNLGEPWGGLLADKA